METLLNKYHLSDNIEFLKELPDDCIDSIITDSPYGLGKEPDAHKCIFDWVEKGFHEVKGKGFMGKEWDAFVPQPILWKECYRVLKPGGHLLSFFGSRTYDWGTLAIRLAGFEIRDQIQWIYGSGFPKTKQHLKPAHEPICVARKPGKKYEPLNIDEARIRYESKEDFVQATSERSNGLNHVYKFELLNGLKPKTQRGSKEGRYPQNVIFDESTAAVLDEQSGNRPSGAKKSGMNGSKLGFKGGAAGYLLEKDIPASIGGASRFFYVAKASPSERKGMKHPTIKPVKLMTQLVKLYTPEGGIVCDPHFGSGPTGEACVITGRNFIGIDNDPQSIMDADIRFERMGLFAM